MHAAGIAPGAHRSTSSHPLLELVARQHLQQHDVRASFRAALQRIRLAVPSLCLRSRYLGRSLTAIKRVLHLPNTVHRSIVNFFACRRGRPKIIN